MLRKILKTIGWTIAAVIALLLIVLTLVVWILTPPRLTPIVRDMANESLDARVGLSRVELTLWHTFPHLTVDVDSLTVVSNTFDTIPEDMRRMLPADADTLLRVGHFHGAVNVLALLAAKVHLYDISLTGTEVNIVSIDANCSNYDIFKPSDAEDEPTAAPVFMPDVALNRFTITDSLPISYRSIADSVDVRVVIAKSPLIEQYDEIPGYQLNVASGIYVGLPDQIVACPLFVDLGGRIGWDSGNPYELSLNDFRLDLGTPDSEWVKTKWNLAINFADTLVVDKCDFNVGPFSPQAIIGLLPDSMSLRIGDVDTDMAITLSGQIKEPYCVADTLLPQLDATLHIPSCALVYNNDIALKQIEADVDITFPGTVDDAVVTINRLRMAGLGLDFSMAGTLSDLTTDPAFDGKIAVECALRSLPKKILAMLPDSSSVSGVVRLDTEARCSQSNFSLGNFHKIRLNGALELRDILLDVPAESTSFYTNDAKFSLGTSRSVVTSGNVKVDSLLTVSVSADTLALGMDGMAIRLKNAHIGAGCQNRPLSADSTEVIPFGGMLRAERVGYSDGDSLRARLSDISARLVLKRYDNDAHLPQLRMNVDAGSIFFTDRMNFMGLQNSHFDLDASLRPKMVRREMSVADSVRFVQRRAGMMAERSMYAGADSLDFQLDASTSKLIRRLQLSGRITAERGGLFTPYFPLRNRLSAFDMSFSAESMVLHNVRYTCGSSDFTINGAVHNIRRALTRGSTISLDWTMHSDTINVNELVQALYKGADYAAKISSGEVVLKEAESFDDLDRLSDNAAVDSVSAMLIPMNIDAKFRMDADNIVYSDMDLRDFRGELLVSEGALNLRDLRAESELGNVSLSALYSAPMKDEMRFGMGLDLNGIDIKKFIGIIPAVDSLMPLLNSFEGVIDAEIAATADIDSTMNIVMPSLDAAIRLNGRDLVLLDAETFRTIAKWLMFKNKNVNRIEHMEAELLIRNSTMQLFPFVFDFDRYRLAVMGSNDLDLNYKYHISVLKSPLPFKFGINISGNMDDMKVRLGGAKYKHGEVGESMEIVKSTRVNLLQEIDNVFRRGSRAARLGALKVSGVPVEVDDAVAPDTISASDSAVFIKEGLLEVPVDSLESSMPDKTIKNGKKKKIKK